jgi:hypothetical protein
MNDRLGELAIYPQRFRDGIDAVMIPKFVNVRFTQDLAFWNQQQAVCCVDSLREDHA